MNPFQAPSYPLVPPNSLAATPMGTSAIPNFPLPPPLFPFPPPNFPLPPSHIVPPPNALLNPAALGIPGAAYFAPTSAGAASYPLTSPPSAVHVLSPPPPHLYKGVEERVGGVAPLIAYVGSIADELKDDLVEGLLKTCGGIRKWRRLIEPSGKARDFGFCEFDSVDAVTRAVRILSKYLLKGKQLKIKMDDSSSAYMDRYNKTLTSMREANPLLPDPISRDAEAEVELKRYLQSFEISCVKLGEEASEREEVSLEQLKESPEEEGELLPQSDLNSRKDGANRRYHEDHKGSRHETPERDIDVAFRERERRWEAKELQNMKNFASEREKEAERKERYLRAREEAAEFLYSYDDNEADDEFHTNRKRWRKSRERELEKERAWDEEDRLREKTSVH